MNILRPAPSSPLSERPLILVLMLVLSFALWPRDVRAFQDQDTPPTPPDAPQVPQSAQQTPEELQRLVAPIALYPDSLVAQILAASTFPVQIVEADRWVQDHSDLKGDALAQAVDQQPWDPSIKALAAFPTVLGNMDKNLSWASSLGDAYYNQEQDVMDAIQVMRQRARDAGNLKSTEQQTVTTEESTIVIEPASPEIVYVPAYDPWLVYGGPVVVWPGWYEYPGIWYGGGPFLYFGVGFGIGFYGGYGWGWHHWRSDWHDHYVRYGHDRYYSSSRTFYHRDNYYRGDAGRGGISGSRREGYGGRGGDVNRNPQFDNHQARDLNRPGEASRPLTGNTQSGRGNAPSRGETGVRSGAFNSYGHGGQEREYSSRGSSSFGGGGSHGGGAGRHR